MNRKIIEHDVANAVEMSAGDPIVVPVDGEMGGEHVADEALGDRVADVTEMRGPAAVLIDGEFAVALFGKID